MLLSMSLREFSKGGAEEAKSNSRDEKDEFREIGFEQSWLRILIDQTLHLLYQCLDGLQEQDGNRSLCGSRIGELSKAVRSCSIHHAQCSHPNLLFLFLNDLFTIYSLFKLRSWLFHSWFVSGGPSVNLWPYTSNPSRLWSWSLPSFWSTLSFKTVDLTTWKESCSCEYSWGSLSRQWSRGLSRREGSSWDLVDPRDPLQTWHSGNIREVKQANQKHWTVPQSARRWANAVERNLERYDLLPSPVRT